MFASKVSRVFLIALLFVAVMSRPMDIQVKGDNKPGVDYFTAPKELTAETEQGKIVQNHQSQHQEIQYIKEIKANDNITASASNSVAETPPSKIGVVSSETGQQENLVHRQGRCFGFKGIC